MNRCDVAIELHRRVRKKYPDLKINMYQVRYIIRECLNIIVESAIDWEKVSFEEFGTFYCEDTKPAARGDFHGNVVVNPSKSKFRFHVSPSLRDKVAAEAPAHRKKVE